MFNRTRLILSFICAVVTCGCTTTPPQASADISLIHSSLAYSLSASETTLSPELRVDNNGIFIAGNQYEILSRYTSVSGKNCVRFSRDNLSLESACQQNGQWKRLKSLVVAP